MFFSQPSVELDPLLDEEEKKQKKLMIEGCQIVPFQNIAGQSGVFIGGSQPCWIFLEKGYLRLHSMKITTPIVTMTPFSNVNCKRGFLYITSLNELTIARLDPQRCYNAVTPVKRVTIGETPHHVAVNVDQEAIFISTSTPVALQTIDDGLLPGKRIVPPYYQQFRLQSYNLNNLQFIDKHELKPFEHVTSMKLCRMEGKEEKRKEYIPMVVVGATTLQHEDVASQGRLMIFKVELGRLVKVGERDLRSPCGAICELDGYVAVSCGSKYYVYYFDWENMQFVPAAFHDGLLYCTSMSSLKRFLVVADRYKSLAFFHWKKGQGNALIQMSRDYLPLQVHATGFIVFEDKLAILSSDNNENIQVFQFAPKKLESLGGKCLLAQADFNVGAIVHEFVRLEFGQRPDKQLSVMAKSDGSFAVMMPITEQTHRRLASLQSHMYTRLWHYAGLHPKAFRLFKPDYHSLNNAKKNVIDGQLLSRYLNLNSLTQNELSKQISLKVDVILEILKDIERELKVI